MSDPLFVDASAQPVYPDDGMTILLKTTSPDQWFYVERKARMATGRDGLFILSLVRRRRREKLDPAGTERIVTEGGAGAAQVQLVALAPSSLDESAWTEALRRSGATPSIGGRWRFLPLPLWKGRMTVGGADAFVDDPVTYKGVSIGTPTAAPVTLRLNPQGADAFWEAIGAGVGPPVAVRFDYEYDLVVPRCGYLLTADARAAHAVFGRHGKAAAAYYGTAGGQAELELMCDELRCSGAVAVSWELNPEGFDTARIAAMERAIVQRWAKRALDQMVESVEPDPDASSSDRGLGAVIVKFKDEASVESVDLSERHEGQRFARETFSRSINLGQLRGLERDKYAADIEDDAAVPIVLNFGQEPRAHRYVCHYGYRRADGTVAGGSHEAIGSEGLSVFDMIRWNSSEPRPEHVEIQFSIEWADLQWETQTGKAVLKTDVPCVAFSLSPATGIAEIALVSDLTSAELGSLGVINWRAKLPPVGEDHPRNYSGSFFIEGAGEEGQLVREVVAFPYYEGREATTIFEWTADLAMPDGTVLSGRESFSLAEKTEAGIFRARLGLA